MKFKIGSYSYIFLGCTFDCAGGLELGSNSVINSNCRLDSRGGLSIGNCVSVSSETIILTADHDMDNNMEGRLLGVRIEDFVWMGTRSMILPGVEVKSGSVIAAGAIVTKTVIENSVVGGIPARLLKNRDRPTFGYIARYKRLFQ